jgi:hypothetical protein
MAVACRFGILLPVSVLGKKRDSPSDGEAKSRWSPFATTSFAASVEEPAPSSPDLPESRGPRRYG